ncbi:hypothetical protein C5S32_12180 [ANME-1 cluster archaeon GoMg1]|nr:hypothetical protein [ANME-1 cluster archaeon GoMg1]
MQNIDLYYESLKQVYDQIESWEHNPSLRERFVDWLVGISGVLFVLSLIPIFPAILVFVGSQTGLVIGPINLSVATFGQFILVWIITTVVTGPILGLMVWIDNKVDSAVEESKRPPQTLSPEQLTFVAVYESYNELKTFFVSHIEQHVNNSLKALKRIVSRRMLWRASPSALHIIGEDIDVGPHERELSYREMYVREHRSFQKSTSSLAMQVSVAQSFLNIFEKYAWFQLDTATKSVLQALISFPAKIYYRLLEKEDLPIVLSILENLSKFIYAYLPEHQTYMEPEALQRLQNDGRKALDSFVQQINDLAPYRPVVEKGEKRLKPEIPPLGFKKNLSRLYADNVFFRFTLWFIIILLLTSGIVYLVNQRVAQLDINVMVSVVIGASATGAAALAAFTQKASKEKVEQEDQRNESDED